MDTRCCYCGRDTDEEECADSESGHCKHWWEKEERTTEIPVETMSQLVKN